MPANRFRTGYIATAEDGASLSFVKRRAGRWIVHYTAAPEAIRLATQIEPSFSPPSQPALLIQGDTASDLVVMHPLNTTTTSASFLQPKYDRLRTITMEGFGLSEVKDAEDVRETLRALPSGFVKDPFFGLGLNWDIRYLIKVVEELANVTDLRLRRGKATGLPILKGRSYVLSAKAFDDARKAINRAHDKALTIAGEEKHAIAHNALLTTLDPERYPAEHRPYRKDAILDAIGASRAHSIVLSANDQKAVVAVTTSAARSVSRSKPEMLLELSREIEVITLEGLLDRLRAMLDRKVKESAWQTFFVENPFILRLAFGLPITMIGDQVSVGGRKFSGSGDKISDFAVKAAASGNLSLIEIKTPQTALLDVTAYRRDLYAPSRELSGAVNQILDQRYQLQKSITLLKDTSGVWDLESYAVQGLIVAGRTPEGKAQIKSLELFRNSFKSVIVVTFDELLGKLEHLLEVLRGPTTNSAPSGPSEVCEEPGEDDDDLEAYLD